MFKIVKNAFDAGRYTLDDMQLLVETDKITAEQYELITGIKYVVDEAGN